MTVTVCCLPLHTGHAPHIHSNCADAGRVLALTRLLLLLRRLHTNEIVTLLPGSCWAKDNPTGQQLGCGQCLVVTELCNDDPMMD